MKEKIVAFLKRKNVQYLLISSIVIFFIVFGIYFKLGRLDLEKNGVIVNAKILERMSPGKSMQQARFKCEFFYKEQKKILFSTSNIRYTKERFEGEYFPALYSEKFDVLHILMTSDDFEEINLKIPDSLIFRVIDIRPD